MKPRCLKLEEITGGSSRLRVIPRLRGEQVLLAELYKWPISSEIESCRLQEGIHWESLGKSKLNPDKHYMERKPASIPGCSVSRRVLQLWHLNSEHCNNIQDAQENIRQ